MTIQDLKDQNLILFEAIVGSRSFGLDTPTSDTDIKGVFYLPKEKFFGMEYIPQINNETNDIVYNEIGRYIELLSKNNPNILELLASPDDCVLYSHPIMEKLHITDFLSKLCKDTFAGYAATQIKKATGLKKKIVNPIAKERKSLIDFCYVLSGPGTISLNDWLAENKLEQQQCGLVNIPHSKDMFALYIDKQKTLGYKGIIKSTESNQVLLSSIPKDEQQTAYLYCNKDAYSSYCKEYKEYWEWVDKRNNDRYNTNSQHGKNYDSKNMMHTIRLLQSAKQILTEGKLNVRVNNRDELLKIKSGLIEYNNIMETANQLLADIEQAYTNSSLPEKPDLVKIEKLLVAIRTELYQ
ncbi:nucleotidyltransferase domain-containing protein [Flavobacterium rhizosphaerae]|uniref:Nucleotidyltransferase domain-containing protein n=1 Tax=Flavobacterium rhizosphaerae TaxID=3163298 RepID=A0ABW8Z2P5_9FLAO